MRFARLFARLLVLVSLSLQGADPLDTWQLQTAAPELRGMAEGPPGLVVTGFEGTILLSRDGGAGWERQNSGTTLPIFSVVWADGEFVATGRGGLILTSPDGTRWTQRPVGVTDSLPAVVYANGVVVVAGFNGVVFTSTNRIDWQRRDTGGFANFAAITYGNGIHVAVGEGGAIYYSSDLAVWRPANSSTTRQLHSVRYLNGLFVAVGERNTFLTSKDGVHWAPGSVASNFYIWDVTFLDGKYWVIGQNTDSVWTSPDLKTWTKFSTAPTTLLKMMVTQGRILAVGPSGCIRATTNGATWTTLYSGPFGAFWRFDWVNGEYSAGSSAGLSFADLDADSFDGIAAVSARFHSADGVRWQLEPDATPKFTGAAVGNHIHVRVGSKGLIESSTNGAIWTARDAGSSPNLRDIVHANGQFVAVGGESFGSLTLGVILTSPDGVTWTWRETGMESRLEHVIYGNGMYLAGGAKGYLTSVDGTNWTARRMPASPNAPPADGVRDLAFGNGRFVAVRALELISTSRDGITWSETVLRGMDLSKIAFGAGRFVGVGKAGLIMSSPDGVKWTLHNSKTANWLRGVAFLNERFAAGGENGTIVMSQPMPAKAPELVEPARDTIIGEGAPATLSARISVAEPATYQWFKDGQVVPGATNAPLQFPLANPDDSGSYHLVVSNAAGTLITPPVNLAVTRSRPADDWRVISQPLAQADLDRLAFIRGTYVATTLKGSLTASTDGVKWTQGNLPPGRFMRYVTTIGANCVAVGDSGQGFVSTDGLAWTGFAVPTTQTLHGVCQGQGLWVVVGDQGTIFTSRDLKQWTARENPFEENLYAVTYGGDQFMAVGENGIVMYSFEGTEWDSEFSATTRDLQAIAFGNGIFLAGGKGGVLVSSPGTGEWRQRENHGSEVEYRDVVFSSKFAGFVAAGIGVSETLAISDTGGTTWGSPATYRPPYQGLAITTDGVVTSIAGMLFKQTQTGGSWVPLDTVGTANLRGVAGGSNFVVAVGGGGSALVLSGGLVTTHRRLLGVSADFLGVAWGGGRAVIVGDGGSIITTADAINWQRVPSGTTNSLQSVCFGDGVFVAAGASGALVMSTNGVDWSTQPSPTTNTIRSVKFAEGRYWINTSSSRVLVSKDTINWTTNNIFAATSSFGGLAVGEGTGVLLDGPNTLVSPDSVNWSKVDNYTPVPQLTSVAFGGETFVMAGEYGSLRLSAKGADWYSRAIPTAWRILNIAVVNDRFYAVGEYGTILESTPFGRAEVKPGNIPELIVHGSPGHSYRIDYRDALTTGATWRSLTNLFLSTNTVNWRDPDGVNQPSRFYRAISQP